MANYSKEQVKQMLRQGNLRNIGQGESSTWAQHQAAIDFWQAALDLADAGEVRIDRAQAESQIQHHGDILARLSGHDWHGATSLEAPRPKEKPKDSNSYSSAASFARGYVRKGSQRTD